MDWQEDEPTELCTARTPFEAEAIAEALRSRGIEAHAFTLAAGTLLWEGGITNLPRVQVRRDDLVAARDALKALRESATKIDWDSAAIAGSTGVLQSFCMQCGCTREGMAEADPCPECGVRPQDVRGDPAGIPGVPGLQRANFKWLLYAALIVLAAGVISALRVR